MTAQLQKGSCVDLEAGAKRPPHGGGPGATRARALVKNLGPDSATFPTNPMSDESPTLFRCISDRGF